MAEGWLIEAQLQNEEGDWLGQTYCAYIGDEQEAIEAVRKYVTRAEEHAEADAGLRRQQQDPVIQRVGEVEALGLVSEEGLAFLALEPGKVARWA